jgi:hypothetical protein
MSLRNFRRASRPQGLPAMTGFAVLAGSCTALFGPIAPGAAQLACCVAAGACAFALRRPLALAFCLGLLLTLLACRAELAMRWPADESGVRVVAQVKVESIPVERCCSSTAPFGSRRRSASPARCAPASTGAVRRQGGREQAKRGGC